MCASLTAWEESVSYDTYQNLIPESRVPVRYSGTNPDVVRLEGQSKTFQTVLLSCMMLLGGLFSLIGAWMVISNWQGLYRARRLARRGQVAIGRVTDRWPEADSDGDNDYCVAYCFAEPGRPETRAAEYSREAYHNLQMGDPVQVRYVPDRPGICRLEG